MSARPKSRTITLTLELEPDSAAALKRLCDKFSYTDAAGYLYPHVPKSLRDDQAHQMMRAIAIVDAQLEDAGVRGWPWIETGSAQ